MSATLHGWLLVSLALAADPLGPGTGPWDVEKPEDHSLDTKTLDKVRDHIYDNMYQRACLVVIKDGALVYEWYFQPFVSASTANAAHSVTKTLGALVTGWAATHAGLDIDADITTAYGVPSPKSYPVTSRQIMSQALAGDHGPGEAWAYDTTGTNWINNMTRVISAATNQTSKTIWSERFQGPLGLSSSFSWVNADTDWADGSQGTCRDYARIGQLMLNKGSWKGMADPIVSSDFIREMGTPQTKYAPYQNYSNPCYGLLTWIDTTPGSNTGSKEYPGVCQMWPEKSEFPAGSPSDVFFAAGVLGQISMVIPEHDMVMVSMGTSLDDYALQRLMYEGVCMMYPDDCSKSYANVSHSSATVVV